MPCICSWRYCSRVIFPSSSTGEKLKSSSSARESIRSPSSAFRNSPWLFNSFSAFHCLGLWLAVMMMPPWASSFTTAISVVGVVAMSISVTSHPIPSRVPVMIRCTMSPEIRASRPTTIRGRAERDDSLINVAYAAVNFTISRGVRFSPLGPPIVPRIPDMDLINVIMGCLIYCIGYRSWCSNRYSTWS